MTKPSFLELPLLTLEDFPSVVFGGFLFLDQKRVYWEQEIESFKKELIRKKIQTPSTLGMLYAKFALHMIDTYHLSLYHKLLNFYFEN